MTVRCLSEPVSPCGGLQAQGVRNLLGSPPFGPLTLVLREAAQNIWDARKQGRQAAAPRMLVRVRTLTKSQSEAMQSFLGTRNSSAPGEETQLSRRLRAGGETRVLEICDFGTTGLTGHADPTQESSKFVRFFFDIGSAHSEEGTGGTYGFGRASLYLAGEAFTILVDTQAKEYEGGRRFMGCHLGESYSKVTGGVSKRYTGRHFWGSSDSRAGTILPLEGDEAENWAQRIGMPDRGSTRTGTTIMIPWPVGIGAVASGSALTDILLHNLWPKRVRKDQSYPMEIGVEVDGVKFDLHDPLQHPIYGAFATALIAARTRLPPAHAVGPQSPRVVAGHLALERLTPLVSSVFDQASSHRGEDESESEDEPTSIFRNGVHHIACMRPSELVVRYEECPGAPPDVNWAGVFVTVDDEKVRNAFAASEPPAHDDWLPDKLKGQDAKIVRVTKRRMRERALQQFGVANNAAATSQGGRFSLAEAGDAFAQQFLLGEGTGSATRPTTPGKGPVPVRQERLVPKFLGFTIRSGNRCAIFGVASRGGGTQVRAVPRVASADGEAIELPDGVQGPSVEAWVQPDGVERKVQEISFSNSGQYQVIVAFHGMYAIELDLEPERATA